MQKHWRVAQSLDRARILLSSFPQPNDLRVTGLRLKQQPLPGV